MGQAWSAVHLHLDARGVLMLKPTGSAEDWVGAQLTCTTVKPSSAGSDLMLGGGA